MGRAHERVEMGCRQRPLRTIYCRGGAENLSLLRGGCQGRGEGGGHYRFNAEGDERAVVAKTLRVVFAQKRKKGT